MALAQDFVRRAEARYNAGTTPKLDLVRAQVELARAENDLIGSERDVANARAALNRLVGRPLGAPIAAADSLSVPPAPPELDRLLAAASASRPELGDLKSQQAGARAASGLAQEYWLPDLTVGISHDYADPGPGRLHRACCRSRSFEQRSPRRTTTSWSWRRRTRTSSSRWVRTSAPRAAATAALRQAVHPRTAPPLARQATTSHWVSYGPGLFGLELDARTREPVHRRARGRQRYRGTQRAAPPLDSLETEALMISKPASARPFCAGRDHCACRV